MTNPKKLYASIDVGTNSALLLIAKFGYYKDADGETQSRLEPTLEKLESLRMGEDLGGESGQITLGQSTLSRLETALLKFRQVIHNLGAQLLSVTFTEALRKADNQLEVLEKVQHIFRLQGIKPLILSGAEEAYGSWLGISHYYDRQDFASLDIGAGSTEISTHQDRISLSIGAMRISKEYGPIPNDSIRDWLLGQTEEIEWRRYKDRPLYLCGGTATALAALNLKLTHWDGSAVESYPVDSPLLQRSISRLSDLSKDVRDGLPGLDKGRGDLIVPGLKILEIYLEKIHPEVCRVTNLGLRYGMLVHKLCEQGLIQLPEPPERIDWDEVPWIEETTKKSRKKRTKKSK